MYKSWADLSSDLYSDDDSVFEMLFLYFLVFSLQYIMSASRLFFFLIISRYVRHWWEAAARCQMVCWAWLRPQPTHRRIQREDFERFWGECRVLYFLHHFGWLERASFFVIITFTAVRCIYTYGQLFISTRSSHFLCMEWRTSNTMAYYYNAHRWTSSSHSPN